MFVPHFSAGKLGELRLYFSASRTLDAKSRSALWLEPCLFEDMALGLGQVGIDQPFSMVLDGRDLVTFLLVGEVQALVREPRDLCNRFLDCLHRQGVEVGKNVTST